MAEVPCNNAEHPLALEAVNVYRAVPGKILTDNISVQVKKGDVLAIVGPSGSGKSSFLRLLNRLDEPTRGVVKVDGEDYRSISPEILRRRVGMVMQSAYLFPGTVGENVAFGPAQRGKSLPDTRIDALLERVGLSEYGDRDVDNLSGGEAQRVSIARTLANEPEILLLDEPTSALDESTALEIETLVRDIIRERHMTCVIVTHSNAQARRVASRTMIIESGKLAKIGPTDEVLRDD
ncbi:ABC transporter ATP-binding protein [Methyloceanibacter caenitepidi]|uniref:YbbL ABC transporter ATP-binding protein n=1 Tax=Methyloceanibacter caenitepidi TaxID=1384459 RepID=A0A0A8K0Z7_9HYPH|nr:phosphate ABC transporter ATP-binding protein [Methyloceanibacter caenitepidi]BAQ16648.1 YbbL ABC transporter ATP-binding protein [Methyloceanibacter caenitepidi]